jgi:hypothetical protein
MSCERIAEEEVSNRECVIIASSTATRGADWWQVAGYQDRRRQLPQTLLKL